MLFTHSFLWLPMGTGRPRLAAAQVVFEAKRSMGGQGGGLLVGPPKHSRKPVVASEGGSSTLPTSFIVKAGSC